MWPRPLPRTFDPEKAGTYPVVADTRIVADSIPTPHRKPIENTASFLVGPYQKPQLLLNETVTIPIVPMNQNVRFTYIQHGAKPPNKIVVVEIVGPIAAASAQTVKDGEAKSKTKKFKFSGVWSADQKNILFEALALTPESALVDGLTFGRDATPAPDKVLAKGEVARHDPNTNTIWVHDNAFDISRDRTVIAIGHEIGHAADNQPITAAKAVYEASKKTPADEETFKKVRRLTGLDDASEASPKDVTEFRKAAKKDGVSPETRPRKTSAETTATLKGSPTNFGDTDWKELFADTFALYVTDPSLLKAIRPTIHDYFLKTYPRKAGAPAVVQPGNAGKPAIQRQPKSGSTEIEMPAEVFPAEPSLIKSRRGPTDWIRDVAPSGSLDEKQWADALKASDIAKLYADIAKVAQAAKVFEGPAAVKTADSITIIKEAKQDLTPGLNFSPFFMDRGGTFFVKPEGGRPFVGYSPSRTDPLPKVAIVLTKEALATKSMALGVLRHEMVHAEHLTMVLKQAEKWRADTAAKSSSFEDWLKAQNTKGRLSDLDRLLVTDQVLSAGQKTPRAANTELLSYTEEFMTEFLLTSSAPANNNDPAFLPLFGVITSSAEPWASANISARAEALGRLQEYFCHVLDRPHQDAFGRFATSPPGAQMPGVSWPWAPNRQMHTHFFEGLKRVVDNKCGGVGKRPTK